MFVPRVLRLRNIRHPGWVWQNEVAVEDVLETVDELLGASTDDHSFGIDGSLGVFFIPLGDGFSQSWETLDMQVILLVGIFCESVLHGLWYWEWTLTKSELVDFFSVFLEFSLQLCHEKSGRNASCNVRVFNNAHKYNKLTILK